LGDKAVNLRGGADSETLLDQFGLKKGKGKSGGRPFD